MRIGVISDTHDRLPNVVRIVELLNQAGVDRVVHTGDITTPRTLEVLAGLRAPLVGVYGNNDAGEREALSVAARRLGIELRDPPLRLEWARRRVVVVHDPRDLAREPRPGYQVALFGHTHAYHLARGAGRLLFNPGECAGHLEGHNAVGVVDLGGLDAERIRF